jgi:hypothetical protein
MLPAQVRVLAFGCGRVFDSGSDLDRFPPPGQETIMSPQKSFIAVTFCLLSINTVSLPRSAAGSKETPVPVLRNAPQTCFAAPDLLPSELKSIERESGGLVLTTDRQLGKRVDNLPSCSPVSCTNGCGPRSCPPSDPCSDTNEGYSSCQLDPTHTLSIE